MCAGVLFSVRMDSDWLSVFVVYQLKKIIILKVTYIYIVVNIIVDLWALLFIFRAILKTIPLLSSLQASSSALPVYDQMFLLCNMVNAVSVVSADVVRDARNRSERLAEKHHLQTLHQKQQTNPLVLAGNALARPRVCLSVLFLLCVYYVFTVFALRW